jgi:putative hemolysin
MPRPGLLVTPGPMTPPAQMPDPFPFRSLMQRLMPMERLRQLYRRVQQPVNRSILENVLAEMRVEWRISEADLARIPENGPAVVTSNHPFGLLDGAVLGALLNQVRPDVKVLTNHMLSGVPELHEYCIFVDPFGGEGSIARNRRSVRQALQWLENGGMLAMFPSGEVSHFRFRDMSIADPEWNSMAARLVRRTGAVAVPVFLPGSNSPTFQALGVLHPQLRTQRLISEFLQQTDREVEVRLGSKITAETLRNAGSDRDAASYLRWRTYILSERDARHARPAKKIPAVFGAMLRPKPSEPVAAAVPAELLAKNLKGLAAEDLLFQNREFAVYLARASQIPDVLQEIGRLREVTFRAVGEGVGREVDLDRFDDHYRHLLLWSRERSELVGSYRIGFTSEILPAAGVGGLYTNTLFRYEANLFDELGPALELGRSFVRLEYQRQYAPLLMLWKGIGRYLAAHPEFAVLFGAVSISNRYCPWSRELLFRFFTGQDAHHLARLVTPRAPFRPRWLRQAQHFAPHSKIRELDQLTDPIADVEPDGKGVPILLKHYSKLGGRMLGFNVDKDFSDVLDGLVLVDLRKSDRTVLQRYMGDEGVRAFLGYHNLASPEA